MAFVLTMVKEVLPAAKLDNHRPDEGYIAARVRSGNQPEARGDVSETRKGVLAEAQEALR
jgi:hypothetical protein